MQIQLFWMLTTSPFDNSKSGSTTLSYFGGSSFLIRSCYTRELPLLCNHLEVPCPSFPVKTYRMIGTGFISTGKLDMDYPLQNHSTMWTLLLWYDESLGNHVCSAVTLLVAFCQITLFWIYMEWHQWHLCIEVHVPNYQ